MPAILTEVEQWLEDTFRTVPGLPTIYVDNENVPDPVPDEFVVFNNLYGNSALAGISGRSTRYRTPGVLSILIMIKVGEGNRPALVIFDAIRDTFEGLCCDLVHAQVIITSVSLTRVGRSASERHSQWNANIEYSYDSNRTRP